MDGTVVILNKAHLFNHRVFQLMPILLFGKGSRGEMRCCCCARLFSLDCAVRMLHFLLTFFVFYVLVTSEESGMPTLQFSYELKAVLI